MRSTGTQLHLLWIGTRHSFDIIIYTCNIFLFSSSLYSGQPIHSFVTLDLEQAILPRCSSVVPQTFKPDLPIYSKLLWIMHLQICIFVLALGKSWHKTFWFRISLCPKAIGVERSSCLTWLYSSCLFSISTIIWRSANQFHVGRLDKIHRSGLVG